MKRIHASATILLLSVAMSAGCGKKDKEKPKEAPKTEAPKAEAPKAEAPKAEAPKAGMPENTVSVFVSHEVEDFDKWKKAFDAHTEQRKAASAIWHSVARDVENENLVHVHVVGTDMAKAKAFLESEDLKTIMTEAGVKGKPTITMASDVEIKSPEGRVEGDTYGIVARHEVADFDKWKTVFDSDADRRSGAMTVIGGSVSRVADNDNQVILHFMVTDPAKFKEALESDELKAKMKEGGVKGKPEVAVGKVVEVSMYQ